MTKLKFLITTLLLMFCIQISFAQIMYSTKNKKAIKYFDKAMEYFQIKDMESCESNLLKAVKEDDWFIEAHLLLGQIYDEQKQKEKAIDSYNKVVKMNPDFYEGIYFNLGDNEFSIGRYEEAKQYFEKFLTYPDQYPKVRDRAKYLLKCCNFAVEAIKNPVPFNPINMGPGVNTPADEYYPQITVDDKTFLFTRHVQDSLNQTKLQEDFFISEKDSSGWGKAINIGQPINTSMNEGAPAFSPDGRYIIFTACEKFGEYGIDRTGFGSCDFFYTKKVGNTWTKPINIGTPVNSGAWETQPSISSDGKTLYFIRGPKGGKGNSDIYMSSRNDDGTWSLPVALSVKINTPLREESVFIHPDNKTLYFSSEGHIGMGGFDLYMSKKDSTGEWGDAVNLGYPINTCGNETSLFIDAKGDLAYFSSDREGGYGNLDIYYFELYDKIRPQSVTYMKGAVIDKLSSARLEAKFDLIDLKTGTTVIESNSDAVNGEFLVCLPTDKDYALNVSKEGYLFYSENFTLTGLHPNTDPYMKNILLQPIKPGESVVLKNIFFDTDKYELKAESTFELKKLTELLNKNPKMKIEISGHTDNIGTPDYNQKLSENRSKSVFDYLVNNGIDKTRLSYKGYGLTKPIDTNDTEEGRANNRRTEFKVMSN